MTPTINGVKTLINDNRYIKRRLKKFYKWKRQKTKSLLQRIPCNNNLSKSQKREKQELKSMKKRKWLKLCICRQWVTNSILSWKLDWGTWEWNSFMFQTLSELLLIRQWPKWAFGIPGILICSIKLLKKKIQHKRWKLPLIQ